jgi:predicted DNA-binding protein
MSKTDMKNLHVPLPQPLYRRLREEAKRAHRPATVLVREAIDLWLAERYRASMHDAIASYAHKVAGTSGDLDLDVEAAGVQHLVDTGENSQQADDQ